MMATQRKRESKKSREKVLNRGCRHNTPCYYFPNCSRGDECWYQHFESARAAKKKKELAVEKAKEIVTSDHELLSQIYEEYDNCAREDIGSKQEHTILYQLAAALSVDNSFLALQIGRDRLDYIRKLASSLPPSSLRNGISFQRDATGRTTINGVRVLEPPVPPPVSTCDDTILISNLGNAKVINILDVLQHYQCRLESFDLHVWKYADLHELRFGLSEWLKYNQQLKELDLSYLNYGLRQHDFNALCRDVKQYLPCIKMFGISGRSQSGSMLRAMYDVIKSSTSLTRIKLKLLYDINDFGDGGCVMLNTQSLADALFDNEKYLEMQIAQIQECLLDWNVEELSNDIIMYVWGDEVLNQELKLTVEWNIYTRRPSHDDDDFGYNFNTFDSDFKQLQEERKRKKSIIKRKLVFKSSSCYS